VFFLKLFLCFSVVFVEEGIRIVIVLKRCVGMLVAWVSGKIPQIDQSKGKKGQKRLIQMLTLEVACRRVKGDHHVQT